MDRNSRASCIDKLEDQIREYYGRVVYTHKAHEKQASMFLSKSRRFRTYQIIISGIVSSGIVSVILTSSTGLSIATAVVSFLSFALNAYLKNSNFDQLAQSHSDIAVQVWDIRERLLSLLIDVETSEETIQQLKKKRDVLHNDLHRIYSNAPRTSKKAYEEASRALKEMEEMTFNDSEIDKFLPQKLRKKSAKPDFA